ncbi:hypothetical protein C0993_011166 [Termitomyces sp. T159_Od127]|nr:hypothetical protein C0993_011166 [Termitomyces sp. T159_Od127]
MIASTPSKDYLALRTSPSYRSRHSTPPRRVSPTSDLPSYDSPMLTPSPLRQQPLFPNPFNPALVDPDDFFLQSPFKSPAQAHHLHTVYTTKPQPIPSDDDDGSIFLSSSSSYSPSFPTSTSQPLRTPVKQIHRFSSRSALSVKQINSMPVPHDALGSATRIGVGTKRKSTPHTSTPIRRHNLTPLVISSQRVRNSASDVVMLDRLAPLPAPKFIASTPQSKAETDAHLKRQTATLTRLKLSDFVEPCAELDVDSGCEMGDDDYLFSRSQGKAVRKGKGKEKEEVAEAISPGGHITKRRARRRPLSAELLESARSPSSTTKATNTQRTQGQRNTGITFPSAPHNRKRSTSGSSSSDVGSPVPRRRVSNTRLCPPKVTSIPSMASHLPMTRQDSATLFFGPAIPQTDDSVPTSRSRANSSLSSAPPSINSARKTTKRHSYGGHGAASNNNLHAWTTIQTRNPSPSPKSSPPAISPHKFRDQDDDDEDMFFGGGPQDPSFVFSVTEFTPSPRTKKMRHSTLQSKYKPRDSGIALDDEHDGGTDHLNVMPGTSTSVGSLHSDNEDNLVTPGTGPEAGSEWPSIFITGTDDATSKEGLDVDAFIMRTLAAASKNPEGKKRVPGTPVKKVKKTYLPAGQRAWQSAVAVKVGPRVDFEPKKGNKPRKSLPAKLPLRFDTDSEDDDDYSPGKRENYAGLGIGRPSASTRYDGKSQTLRTRWLMRRSSSGAFSSGSESFSSSGTPTRPKNKESRVSSLASQLSPLQKDAFKLSMARTASNSSSSSTGTLNSPSIASSRRLQPINRTLPVPDTYQQSEDQPTSRFERNFVVDSEIGSGEFGKVIKVRCKDGNDDDNIYAVKQSKRVEGPRHRLRLQEEVQVLRHLSHVAATSGSYEGNCHPNVLAYIDSWEENDVLYIQTEVCTSGNLQQFLETFGNAYRKLSEDRVWKILVDLSNGLRFVHDAGVIHLDLKPSNIFVTGEGRLKIGDFGMATFFPRLETVAGSKGFEREGDKRYLAPEILQEDYYSKAADIFSLGMTILEAAANIVVPDQGEDWHRLRRDDFSQVLLDESPELLEIIKRMMRQRPHERMSIHDVCGHAVVCRAREVMERVSSAAKRDKRSLLGASPFGRAEAGFLDEILGRAMDVGA